MVDIYTIRKGFQDYMLERGYQYSPSDTLVSDTFPTCFTVSGGPNLVGREQEFCTFITERINRLGI